MDGSAVLGTAALDSSGAATFSTGTLSVGTHTVTAIYNSDGNFSASVSNTLTQQVNAVLGSISGVVYRDLTGNGLSSDDQPMSGVTVQLLRVVHGAATVVTSATSDANGIYRFTNLVAGNYRVQELTPKGYARTAPKTSPYYSVTVSGGTVVTSENFDNFDKSSHSGQSLKASRLLVHQKNHR
jgi:hypothetical protein